MNKKGGFIGVLLVIVIFAAALLVLLYVWQNTSGTNTAFNSVGQNKPVSSAPPVNNPLIDFGSGNSTPSSGSTNSSSSSKNSPYAGMIALSSGSAPSSYQPNEQYVEIYNSSQSPITISGWSLENNPSRPFQTTGNSQVTVAAEKVAIPQGTNFLDPSGSFVTGPIILKPGDTAIVTVGSAYVSYTYKISTSFRANKCGGYLNYTYPFYPELDQSCPAPASEPGINGITDVCYNYVRYLPLCYNPAVQDASNLRNNFQQNCVDYIDSHFSYPSCVAIHKNDGDFNLPTWRIFLGLSHELWRQPDDSVKLLDQNGLLVAEVDY